ncbi:hypothetical protein DYB26_009743 [Aphanomyces astaci]|uniref:Uncharacterized protein n=1 Tax=Aphanomyces astaci TaxID=112090 RepID=A0A397FZM5_APHAT|nr:hypothetical protein DYB26_009743 [Aphanomyces astaci]RHZ37801.1 hypothetical protein DYB31_011324 [Aphanomyces astaci]
MNVTNYADLNRIERGTQVTTFDRARMIQRDWIHYIFMKVLHFPAALLALLLLPHAHADCNDSMRSAYLQQRSLCVATSKLPHVDPAIYCQVPSCRDALGLLEGLAPTCTGSLAATDLPMGCQRYLRLIPSVVGACHINATTAPGILKATVDREMPQCDAIVRSNSRNASDAASKSSISLFLIAGLVGGIVVLVLALVIQKRRHRLLHVFHHLTFR